MCDFDRCSTKERHWCWRGVEHHDEFDSHAKDNRVSWRRVSCVRLLERDVLRRLFQRILCWSELDEEYCSRFDAMNRDEYRIWEDFSPRPGSPLPLVVRESTNRRNSMRRWANYSKDIEQNSLESTAIDIRRPTDRSRREMEEEHELERRKKRSFVSSLQTSSHVDRWESVRDYPNRWRTFPRWHCPVDGWCEHESIIPHPCSKQNSIDRMKHKFLRSQSKAKQRGRKGVGVGVAIWGVGVDVFSFSNFTTTPTPTPRPTPHPHTHTHTPTPTPTRE